MSILPKFAWFLAEYSDIMEQARTGRRTDAARARLRSVAMPPPKFRNDPG